MDEQSVRVTLFAISAAPLFGCVFEYLVSRLLGRDSDGEAGR